MATAMPGARLALLLLCLCAAQGAEAAVYRCAGPDEALRFVDDPSQCRSAEVQPLSRALQRIDRGAPRRSAAAGAVDPKDPGAALQALFPGAGELEGAWEIVTETPTDPAGDPDLVGWGVNAVQTRHFTRQRSGGSEVCSVEIWQFRDAALAAGAHQQIAYPGWQITLHGSRIVMLRGTIWQLGGQFEKGVFEGCDRIGRQVRSRVDAASEAAPASAADVQPD